MSLGAGAIQGWCRPCANTRHSREVPWQPCEQEPALQAATNRHRHMEGTSVETYLTWYQDLEPFPVRVGRGLEAELAKQATKAAIHKAKLSKQTANMVTKAVIRPRSWSVKISAADNCNNCGD